MRPKQKKQQQPWTQVRGIEKSFTPFKFFRVRKQKTVFFWNTLKESFMKLLIIFLHELVSKIQKDYIKKYKRSWGFLGRYFKEE